MGWKWCTWWVAREEEPPQIREKTLERLVPLTRGGREGRDSSRLLLEPMLERERERDDDDEEDDDDNGKWKKHTHTHTPNPTLSELELLLCFQILIVLGLKTRLLRQRVLSLTSPFFWTFVLFFVFLFFF